MVYFLGVVLYSYMTHCSQYPQSFLGRHTLHLPLIGLQRPHTLWIVLVRHCCILYLSILRSVLYVSKCLLPHSNLPLKGGTLKSYHPTYHGPELSVDLQVSSSYHMFDYSGIIILTVGSFYPSLYYGFHCKSFIQLFYMLSITLVGFGRWIRL